MKKIFLFILIFSYLFGIQYTNKEKIFLKNNPVIYISAMTYWPTDKNNNSIHTNYIKLLNKYGHINIQPVFYKYWSDGFNDAKNGITYGIMALSYSKKRTQWFYYTKPYNYTPYYLIVNKNSNINSFQDIKKKNIFVAKNSILRETLKNPDFNIIYTKNAYKKLANKKIDGILLFYIPNTKYINKFKIIKTFINKSGEEHIGISKKYPELFTIIDKIMKTIPYYEIEKIRSFAYETKISKNIILKPEIKISDLITIQDIIFILILLSGLVIILFLFFKKKFLNFSVKKFLISMFIFDSFILGFILYEIMIFNHYSNKILELKSKSFDSLYLIDKIEKSVQNFNYEIIRKYNQNKGNINKLFINEYPIFDNLIIEREPIKNLLNEKTFSSLELSHLAYIKKLFNNVIHIKTKLLNHKINYSIYKHNMLYLINEFNTLKDVIKKENIEEIHLINEKLKYQFLLLIFSMLLFIIESIFVFIMIKEKIYNPIQYLINVIKNYQKGEKVLEKKQIYNDEFGKLIKEFFYLQTQLNQKINELKQHKENLEKEVKNEVDKRLYQEKILIKQSKMALMGEMIDAIAHQWKQPLNSIYMSIQIVELENFEITKDELKNCTNTISLQVQHLTNTLDEFRSFFRENKQKEIICMKNIVKRVLLLLKDDLLSNQIDVTVKIENDFCIKGIKNEFEHLLITLITNSKDIFKERKIKNRKIVIQTEQQNDFYYLEVIDNAGGVPKEIQEKIFELNYSTRENGTGVGLYLASQIAIKHMGCLEMENTKNGAKFYFKVRSDV